MPEGSALANTSGIWVTLRFRDADRMIRWLTAVGFTGLATYRDDRDNTVVLHAEMVWAGGGGIMFGTHRENPEWPQQPGTGAAYLITHDPDATHAAALAAGGTSLQAPQDHDYGGRGCSVVDPEGNLWSFGNYLPG